MKNINTLQQIKHNDNVEISTEEEYYKIVELVNKSKYFTFSMLSNWEQLQELAKDFNHKGKIILHSFLSESHPLLSISYTINIDNLELTSAKYFIKNFTN